MAEVAQTLRRTLTRATLWPALVVISISAVFDYKNASDLAQQAQDSLLFKTAVALATRLSPDEDNESAADLALHLDPEDIAMIRTDPGDETLFIVLDSHGTVLAGDTPLLDLVPKLRADAPEVPVYSDQMLQGEAVRLVDFSHTSRGETQRILVTETNHKRSATSRQLVLNTLWPNLVLLLTMMALMFRGTRKALTPLENLGQAIDRRPPDNLTPLPLAEVPGEIQPLVSAINRLLARVGTATAEQQIFLSSAAHQLRTPLAGIHTQLELAAQDATAPIKPRLERILAGIDELAHCTQQMLTLARSSAQAISAHDFAQVSLSELLEDAASTWLDTALRHPAELFFEIGHADCLGSRWMLQQMLGNLVDNAIKHSPGGGHVTVRCGLDAQQHAFLEVQDQGPGISQDDRHHVFEPFFRNASQQTQGSGLGLAIVKEVTIRHQATIQFMDTRGKHGTCIRVTFPQSGQCV